MSKPTHKLVENYKNISWLITELAKSSELKGPGSYYGIDYVNADEDELIQLYSLVVADIESVKALGLDVTEHTVTRNVVLDDLTACASRIKNTRYRKRLINLKENYEKIMTPQAMEAFRLEEVTKHL